ncbi:MAG: coagulation factor 5/8 type domain protein, partial [Turneriella sp.]|nr:coagulation factor 5/8 type domain protein [Turneriella sp.]
AREKAALSALSTHEYALYLPRALDGIKSSGKAIRAEGEVVIDGQLQLKGAACLSIVFARSSGEAFAEGDLVALENGMVAKLRSEQQVCIGVYVKNSALQLQGNSQGIAVAIAGIVPLRIWGVVRAGDKLTPNSAQPGTCRVAQPGERVLAVALEAAQDVKEKIVPGILLR